MILSSTRAVNSAALALEVPLKIEGYELGATKDYSTFQSGDDDETSEDTQIVNLKSEVAHQTKKNNWGQSYRLAAIHSQNNSGSRVTH